MNRSSRTKWAATVAALVGVIGCQQQTAPAASASTDGRQIPLPDYLSPLARDAMRTRMARHGDDMTRILWAALLLDYEEAAAAASHIANEGMLAPFGSDGGARASELPTRFGSLVRDTGSSLELLELRNQLPRRFFELQDELKANATAVQVAAQQHSGARFGEAVGRLQETCISCHVVYMAGPPPP